MRDSSYHLSPMPRPKPDVQLVQVLLRLHPDVIAEIDRRRGDRSRPELLRSLIAAWAVRQAAKLETASPTEPAKSRLKGQWKAP